MKHWTHWVVTTSGTAQNAPTVVVSDGYSFADLQQVYLGAYKAAYKEGYFQASDDICLALRTLKGE